MNELKEGRDFLLHLKDTNKDQNVKIELTTDPFDGIIYQYGNVDAVCEEGTKNMQLVFDVEIFAPEDLRESYEKEGQEALTPELIERMGEVITHFIMGKINNENRTDDS
jgi:hypothetical protein